MRLFEVVFVERGLLGSSLKSTFLSTSIGSIFIVFLSKSSIITFYPTRRGFIDKLSSDEDKLVLTKLLNECYKYSVEKLNDSMVELECNICNGLIGWWQSRAEKIMPLKRAWSRKECLAMR